MNARHVVVAMSPRSRRIHRVIRMVVLLLAKLLFRLEIRGGDRLPASGPYIISPVHRSNIDAFIAASAIPPNTVIRTMAKDSLWEAAWFGRFLERMGAFPVDRERPDRGALRNCEEALAHGEPLLMFPEGRRRSGEVVEEVLEGPAWLACRARVPIVPIGISGTDRAMPIGAKFIRPVKVIVQIGEPLLPDVALTGRVSHKSVVELTDRLREAVQHYYDVARSG